MKKNSPLLFLGVATTILSLSSCYPGPIYDPYDIPESRQKENLYYVPSAPNTQLLSEKNDLDFTLARSAGSKFSGLEAQASYLPGRHVGIIGSYSSVKGDAYYLKYHEVEGGVGYITHLSKEWHFETYAGMRSGKIDNIHATGISKINLTHFFIQPAIVVSNEKKTAQFGFVSKFSGVNFKVDTTFDNAREPFSTSQVTSLYNKPFHIMWEPALVFRFGWKNFLFHTSYSLSADLTNPEIHKANTNFSIGGSLRFNTSAKKVKN
jgi:hypothetical protein